jgi:hypothetical protein
MGTLAVPRTNEGTLSQKPSQIKEPKSNIVAALSDDKRRIAANVAKVVELVRKT